MNLCLDPSQDKAATVARFLRLRFDFLGARKMSKRTGWGCEFDDPIELPDGGELVTLEDAGNYITKLPKAEHEAPVMTFTWKGYGDPR